MSICKIKSLSQGALRSAHVANVVKISSFLAPRNFFEMKEHIRYGWSVHRVICHEVMYTLACQIFLKA